MAKQHISGDDLDAVRRSIDDLIEDDSLPNFDEADSTLPSPMDMHVSNLPEINNSTKEEAKTVVRELMSFYLKSEVIDRHSYAKIKEQINSMSLGAILYQLKLGEMAIEKLVDNIQSGNNLSPRMFEVLSSMQTTLLNIIKVKSTFMLTMEEESKSMVADLRNYQGEEDDDNTSSGGLKSQGTKGLMSALRDLTAEDNDSDVDFDNEEDK